MSEFTISDELYEISEATNPDGTVDVEIVDFEKTPAGAVRVIFKTPTREEKSEVMDWPTKDHSNNKFVRICRKTVGSLSGAKFLKQDGAEITANPDNWTIKAEMSRKDKIRESISNVTMEDIFTVGINATDSIILLIFAIIILGSPIYALLTLMSVVPAASYLSVVWIVSFTLLIIYLTISDSMRDTH